MTYRGHVKNGVVLLDEPAALPEGVSVEVAIAPEPETEGPPLPTLYESLKDVIGKAEGLPADFAKNHDHYLYGIPKK
ncbi:MAG: hypothetical protein GHCLOJNM_00629 [bacterium]|nr:hypothetical protein [bacterium]